MARSIGRTRCALLIDESYSVRLADRLASLSWPGKAVVLEILSFIKMLNHNSQACMHEDNTYKLINKHMQR
jgi:hypothetical protein